MTRNLPSSMFMCEFLLPDGEVRNEADYVDSEGGGGWKRFPLKNKLIGVRLAGREITPDVLRIPIEEIKCWCIHWIGTSTPGNVIPNRVREIMIVLKNLNTYNFCLDLKTGKWLDYTDNLRNPNRPHLIKYDLSIHTGR